MAKSISAAVGVGGRNLTPDVRTIQELLNKVPPGEGGPSPSLKVDGLCGPKTNGAIYKFQTHHFGPQKADGRVDPGHRTITKLNEYDENFGFNTYVIKRVGPSPGLIDLTRAADWFFQVRDLRNPLVAPAVYHLGRRQDEYRTVPRPLLFRGAERQFRVSSLVRSLETPGASYTTELDRLDPFTLERDGLSVLNLLYLDGRNVVRVQIPYPDHIVQVLRNPNSPFEPPIRALASRGGFFQLVV